MKVTLLGSGALARALAPKLTDAGHEVTVGSRQPDAVDWSQSDRPVDTRDYRSAAIWCDVAVLALPYHALAATLAPLQEALAGKVVVDPVNGIGPDWQPVDLGSYPSVAAVVAAALPQSTVAKAFNMVFADALADEGASAAGLSVFVASDDARASATAAQLVRDCGLDPVTAPGLHMAAYLEGMAHLNIALALGGGGTRAGFIYRRLAAE